MRYENLRDYTIIFAICSATFSPLSAHGGEDHGPKTPLAKPLSSANTNRITLKGRVFDGVLVVCEKELTLYLADRATNNPIENAQVEVEFKENALIIAEGKFSREKDSYKIPTKLKEGSKIHIELKITTSDLSEKLSIDVPEWPNSSKNCLGEKSA